MDFGAINTEILALELEIARLCTCLAWLHEASLPAASEVARVTAELDRHLVALREAQGQRNHLLLHYGFPVALGWASRQDGRSYAHVAVYPEAGAQLAEASTVH